MIEKLRRFYASLHLILQLILVAGVSSIVCGAILFAATAGDVGLGFLLAGSVLMAIVTLFSLGNAQGRTRTERS